jgi:putative transposase
LTNVVNARVAAREISLASVLRFLGSPGYSKAGIEFMPLTSMIHARALGLGESLPQPRLSVNRWFFNEANWFRKKKYGQLGTAEIREINELRDENTRLKRLVADLTLDKVMLQDVLSKKL